MVQYEIIFTSFLFPFDCPFRINGVAQKLSDLSDTKNKYILFEIFNDKKLMSLSWLFRIETRYIIKNTVHSLAPRLKNQKKILKLLTPCGLLMVG